MHSEGLNINKKIAALALMFLGAAIFTGTIVHGYFYAPEKEMKVTFAKPIENVNKNELPDRIIIPKIGVNAKVEQVGITFKGNMSTPKSFFDVGWYKYGTIPGNLGSAVIDGHVDNGFEMAGVFAGLK